MKLILLIPNIILMVIAGYNLANDLNVASPNYLLIKMVHLSVLIITVVFMALIIKSMFTVKYIDIPEEEITEDTEYNEYELQHN